MKSPTGALEALWKDPKLADELVCLEHAIELYIEILSQLPTRRFSRALMQDKVLLLQLKTSSLYKLSKEEESPRKRLLSQMIERFEGFYNFPIEDHSGLHQSDETEEAKRAQVALR